MIIDAPRGVHTTGLRSLWKEAFGDTDAFLDAFEKTAFSVDRCRCVMAGDEVAAALYWFDCRHGTARVAYLYAIATAKAYRGQGLCHRLMEDTHGHLARQGYEGAVLVPGSRSLFAFYEGMGYRVCGRVNRFCCAAAEDGIELRQIDRAEYAELRRRFLPRGGVIQENENLRFLQTQATFYSGGGFLLAARGEGNTLYGTELLGDASTAARIVRALGYETGSFRTPGEDAPFAMYRSVTGEAHTPPSYFGLAFD